MIKKHTDKIDIIINEKDYGQADAINKGLKRAHGEIVGWINSDDILYPDCVEKIVELYESKKNAAIYYHSYNDMINESGEIIRTYQHKIPNRKYLLYSNYDVVQQGSFYNLKLVKKVGYLNVENHYCMDLDLSLVKIINARGGCLYS